MRKLLFLVLFVSLSISGLTGCSNPVASSAGQTLGNVVWKSDGSGLYGYYDRFDASTTIDPQQYSLATFSSDGSFGNSITTSLPYANGYFSPLLSVSADNAKAVTQLGENLYQVDLPSGNQTLLTTKVNLLAVSPDQKYAIVSPSPSYQPTKTISVLNIAARPVYEVKKWDVTDVNTNSGLWLKNGMFALTVNTNGGQIRIFDTLGTMLDTISSAIQVFHNGNYVASTDILYFLNTATNIDGYQLGTKTRSHLFSKELVSNFDISANGTLAAVVTSTGLYALNIETGAQHLVTSDILWGAFLSPDANHVAYVRSQSSYYEVIGVMPIALP